MLMHIVVSEYTDKVDILSSGNRSSKNSRKAAQIRDICGILCGLTVATEYKTGQDLIVDKNYSQLEHYFQRVFEIGRRHKVSYREVFV